jgi:hypothetical protein
MMTFAYISSLVILLFIMWDDIKTTDFYDVLTFNASKQTIAEFWAAILGLAFAPITMCCVGIGYGFKKANGALNRKFNQLMHQWDTNAAQTLNKPVWELRNDPETHAIALREAAKTISTIDLKVISRMDRDERKDYRIYIHAAIDELFERAIVGKE